MDVVFIFCSSVDKEVVHITFLFLADSLTSCSNFLTFLVIGDLGDSCEFFGGFVVLLCYFYVFQLVIVFNSYFLVILCEFGNFIAFFVVLFFTVFSGALAIFFVCLFLLFCSLWS